MVSENQWSFPWEPYPRYMPSSDIWSVIWQISLAGMGGGINGVINLKITCFQKVQPLEMLIDFLQLFFIAHLSRVPVKMHISNKVFSTSWPSCLPDTKSLQTSRGLVRKLLFCSSTEDLSKITGFPPAITVLVYPLDLLDLFTGVKTKGINKKFFSFTFIGRKEGKESVLISNNHWFDFHMGQRQRWSNPTNGSTTQCYSWRWHGQSNHRELCSILQFQSSSEQHNSFDVMLCICYDSLI